MKSTTPHEPIYLSDFSDTILQTVITTYLGGDEFNGVPCDAFGPSLGFDELMVSEALIQLIEDRRIDVQFGDRHPNPAIAAFRAYPPSVQIEKILSGDLGWAYPSRELLLDIVKHEDYRDRPYSELLARGFWQLYPVFFDLSVLEQYRNDPRYIYDCNDTSGWLSVSDDYYRSDRMRERDQVLLQTFGFAKLANGDRAVVVLLRYLHTLSSEHQFMWRSKEIIEDGALVHPGYEASILGNWPRGISLPLAICYEHSLLNETLKSLTGRDLFRATFKERSQRPNEFSFLIRPTTSEFDKFILTFDKMISDNMNKSFFEGEIPSKREDGTPKGTIALLEEWLNSKGCAPDRTKAALSPIRELRSLRQKPAHALSANEWDTALFGAQRELLKRVLSGLEGLTDFVLSLRGMEREPVAWSEIWDF